ncbi:hypothetical protein HPB47_005246 [Ixodes persulcatus]|uniref:Uncharacterized protein n=1 Tax=Ixodes persulcatus TaxID=34615 RepID=A0AC60PER6_IXOPE|nr:hypothetical protein HPB47_005246 [Ixodes persulcatus]
MLNSGGYAMEFDAQSGQTLAPPGPWQQLLSEPPRLPDSNYKVVFRPQTGLRVAAWNERQLTHSLQQASEIPEHLLYARATVQIQASQTLIVAGTPEENCALTLREISTIQLGAATYEVLPYLKPLPEIRRGVIHGLDPGTATDQLSHVLAKNGAPRTQAGRLPKSRHDNVSSVPHNESHTRPRLHPQNGRKKLRPPPPPLRVRERALTSQRCQQQPSLNFQPPEQRQLPPNQPNQQQVSWSTIVASPPTARDQLPLLPTHPTLDRDPDTTPLTSRAPTPVPTNISHFERIIYEMGERLDNHLITLDQRIHANEEAKRHARKRPKQCTLFRTSGDMSPPLQFDDD